MTTMTDTNTADTTAALFAAIDSGNEDRVIELINAGADIFATDAEGASTLTHAQRQGNEIIIQTLQMMAEAQGKEFQDAPDDGDAKDAAGEEEPADGTTVLTDSVDVPEIEEGFFVDPAAIILDKGFKMLYTIDDIRASSAPCIYFGLLCQHTVFPTREKDSQH